MNIKLRSWYLALLGTISFGFYFIPIIMADYIECSQKHCDSGLHMLVEIFYILTIVLFITPVIFLGIKQDANRKKAGILWLLLVFLTVVIISPLFLSYPLNLAFIPFVFLGYVIILFNNIRRAGGAVLSIFLGVLILFIEYYGYIQGGLRIEKILIISSVIFLFAGTFFFLKENKKKFENVKK